MIILTGYEEDEDAEKREATARRERAFASFAARIHDRVPMNHSADLTESERVTRRAFCGEIECGVDELGRDTGGRVVPTRQGLCPRCGGRLHEAETVERMRGMAKRLEGGAA